MPPKTARQLDRFSQFGLVAGTLALDDAGMRPGEARRCVAGADRDLPRQRARRHRLRRGAARAVPREGHPPGRPEPRPRGLRRRGAGEPRDRARRPRADPRRPRTRAPAGAVAIGEALGAIRAGEIDAAIAGGVEIPLSPLAFGAFDIIRALSGGSNDDPEHACRPFDAKRDGFVMGEGAALLVLEAEDVVRARSGAEPYAEVMGYGSTSDAFHMVQPRADGSEAARAASIAMADAAVEPESIDFVSAHASSTPLGDIAEARAIALALGPDVAARVPVSGTKALYGHPLGASGAIEAAICALAIRDGWVPASVNLVRAGRGRSARCCRGCCARAARARTAGSSRRRSGSAG